MLRIYFISSDSFFFLLIFSESNPVNNSRDISKHSLQCNQSKDVCFIYVFFTYIRKTSSSTEFYSRKLQSQFGMEG